MNQECVTGRCAKALKNWVDNIIIEGYHFEYVICFDKPIDKNKFIFEEQVIDANDNETVVLHALRVLPEYGGRGYSKQLVQHAIDTARERNLKSIRLDCIEGNDITQKMYMSFGFKYVDKVEITYVDIGVPRKFLLYEFVL